MSTAEITPQLIDRLRRRMAGHPVQQYLQFHIEELEPDYCLMSLEFRHELDNGGGAIHGGVLAALADTAVACALSTNFDGRMGFATSNLNIHFLKRAKTSVRAAARVIKKGSKVCVGEVEIRDEDGEFVAHAICDFVLTSAVLPR